MKAFSFKQQPSVIRTLKEPKPIKKKLNIDRLLFLGLLTVLLSWLLYYIVSGVAIIEADGQVILEKINVSFTEDIRLTRLAVEEGDTVCKGDELFSYVPQAFDQSGLSLVHFREEQEGLEREQLKTSQDLRQLQLQIRAQKEFCRHYQELQEQVMKLVLLDVYQQHKLTESRQQLSNAQTRLKILEGEAGLLYSSLRMLEDKGKALQALRGNGGDAESITPYKATEDGIISKINFHENEVCYEMQQILTIHRKDQVKIEAYFNPKALEYLKVGTPVDVAFPDGSSSPGRIRQLHIATYALPSEFQKKYEPTERAVLAIIEPIHSSDFALWTAFYMMNVKINLAKYL